MRTQTLFTLTALVALLALAATAGARPPLGGGFHGRHGDDHHERFLERHADRLGVDDATREAIEAKFDGARSQAEPLRVAVRQAHRQLHEMLRADAPDREAVLAQSDAIGALETELRKLRITTLLDVRAMLSEEQRAEMVSIREEHMRARMQPLLAACAEDVDALCPDAEDMPSLMHCLKDNRDAVSDTCQETTEAMRRSRHGGRHGRFGGEGRRFDREADAGAEPIPEAD
jgi:Spy/CpxP family protein refolding chaperone